MITREELRETLRQEFARYPTREELRETLRQELARYPTREELREGLAAVREESAQASADLRRYMKILYENHQEALRTVLETLGGRMDLLEVRLGGNRLSRLEHERKH